MPPVSEHTEQVALFQWAKLAQCEHPELALLFAIPNGGHRAKAVAGKMRAEGVQAGVPDIFLAVPRRGYHGLFVEMKFGKNRPTAPQLRWLNRLDKQGYLTAVCYGFDEARSTIIEYLGEK